MRTRRSGHTRRSRWVGALAALAALAAVGIPVAASASDPTAVEYQQTNLISDIAGVARITDPNLVNPWGQAASASSPLWVVDNGADVSTLYRGGVSDSIPSIVPLVVSIPKGAPSGIVFNSTSDFVVHSDTGSAPANFIFDSENGVVSAWSGAVSGTNAQAEFTSKRAVYKGLALASAGGANYLYAANFRKPRIDVFNAEFKKVHLSVRRSARRAGGDRCGAGSLGRGSVAGRLVGRVGRCGGSPHLEPRQHRAAVLSEQAVRRGVCAAARPTRGARVGRRRATVLARVQAEGNRAPAPFPSGGGGGVGSAGAD